jgi:hypothetical protein
MRLAVVALLFTAACGHGDAALREEQAKARRYRDAYETQAQENAELKKRIAELEQKGCRDRR